jgi:type I restriction enzyme S subunit
MMAIAANIGDLAILGFEAYAPDSVVGFKPNQDIDLEFLRYSFMAALPALEQTSTQSTQANLNVERVGAVQGVFHR